MGSKELSRSHYQRNKEKYLARNRDRRERYRAIVHAEKSKPCIDCGQQYPPRVMDFHHRDPSTKFAGLGSLHNFASEAKLRAEIAKCDLLCANCHRLRH